MLPNPKIIHLEESKDREKSKTILSSFFNQEIPFFTAIKLTSSNPIIWKSGTGWKAMTMGQLSCNMSHSFLYNENDSKFTVFEDDAIPNSSLLDIQEFITTHLCNIILLGYNKILEHTNCGSYLQVKSFWGTHAMIIDQISKDLFLREYNRMMKDGISMPTDWLWSHVIKKYNLNVVAPILPFIIQELDLTSTITRKLRK